MRRRIYEANTERSKRIWCIVKRVPVREHPDKDSKEIGSIEFGNVVNTPVKPETVNGRIKVFYRINSKDGKKQTVTGWASLKAFTGVPVEDYSHLYYVNKTGKRVPVAMKYKGEVAGYVAPEEIVSMTARVGDWCLTNKGWSKWKWFTKHRDIIDQTRINTLCYAVIARASDDYRSCVKKLKKRKYKNGEEFCNLVWQMDDITKWFKSKEYAVMFDIVPGQKCLDILHSELMIDDKWLDERHRVLDSIVKQRGYKWKVRHDFT